MRKAAEILESIVIVAIVLVLVHTFLDDFSILAGWTVVAREWIIWIGLGFDVFFTIEFFTRLYVALSRHETGEYFFRQRGWVDFFASIPLLVLNSLPHALALLAGAGLITGLGSFLNVLKVIKAVRIARVLRLLRVIKLFRGIRYARSPMAQRHISIITTTAVTILVVWTVCSSTLEGFGILPGLEATYDEGQALRVHSIADPGPAAPGLALRAAAMAAVDPAILVVRPQGGTSVWSRFAPAYYAAYFMPGDYAYFAANGVEVFLDARPSDKAAAREAMVFFSAIMLVVLGFLILYAPRFALGISDPLHVMKRGMAESDYNLEVRIPAHQADDDVFELAALYNAVFLPLKDRAGEGGDAPAGGLSVDDVRELVDKG